MKYIVVCICGFVLGFGIAIAAGAIGKSYDDFMVIEGKEVPYRNDTQKNGTYPSPL